MNDSINREGIRGVRKYEATEQSYSVHTAERNKMCTVPPCPLNRPSNIYDQNQIVLFSLCY